MVSHFSIVHTSDRSKKLKHFTDPPTPRKSCDKKMERLMTLLLLTIIGSGIGAISSKPCSTKDLSVFNEVSGQVNKCLNDSKLNFQIPPRSSLSTMQQSMLCKSKACQAMIGSVDDLDIPVCEHTFDKKNMTLQMSLDNFVSSCDTTTPAPSPIKRRKSLEASSADGSGSSSKKRKHTNLATAIQFGTLQQVLVLLAASILSVGLVLP
ncbi:unnamed protein product [Peronospora belbahrii]|uniref:Elicitin-like protein n=1 Tax=Peronospora belbahrii TaxID=622444 RepID=A0AAU9L9J3_9STRA|nr:unnamed protein product [Peronospora belbahrii]CAH0514106.1 unnamed protein product [Peronospora belbahrii]